MILHDMDQRTPEWFAIRSGKLTGSDASSLVTPTGKPSSQYKGAIARNIAEHMGWQESDSSFTSFWMNRGINMEEEALRWFAVEIEPVLACGFIEDDTGLFGVSPDGIIKTDDGIIPVEIKCPMPSTLIKWHMDGGLPTEHIAQVHMAIEICDAPYAYFMAYHPSIKPLLVKVERGTYTEAIEDGMHRYAVEYKSIYKEITGVDYGKLQAL